MYGLDVTAELRSLHDRDVADEQCTRRELHTPSPREVSVWRVWAHDMAQTHVQTRCPGSCGLWNVWVPSEALCRNCGKVPGDPHKSWCQGWNN